MGEGGGEVWSWGAGTHGQLACGTSDEDALTPQRVDALSGAGSLDMACGGAHAVAVFESGEVATWGRGQAGALGHGDEATTTVPRVVSSFHAIRIRSAAAGWNHSAFLTDSGGLYTCGDGTFGQLGHGHMESRLLPCRVEHLSAVHVTMAACGMRHTLALTQGPPGETETAAVYAFGSNKRGQLGLQTNTKDSGSKDPGRVPCPQRISSPDIHGVMSVAANGDHSAALTGTGEMLLWGRGFNNSPDMSSPHLVAVGLKFCQVSLGWRHGLALTEDKEVYAWGSNWCGQLGVTQGLKIPGSEAQKASASSGPGDLAEASEPCKEADGGERDLRLTETAEMQPKTLAVEFWKVETQGRRTVWVSAGSEHSAAVLDDGDVIVWGWAEHGQLGLGSIQDQDAPHSVPLPNPRPASKHGGELGTRVYCGSGFTFVVVR